MRKNIRTKKSYQAHKKSKIKCNYKGQGNQEIKKKNVGKPPNLNTTKIDNRNIWSSNIQIKNILYFLLKNGRHVSIHLAGAKRNSKNEKDEIKRMQKEELQKQIKQSQPLFEFLVNFSNNYLEQNSQKKKTKSRIVVFFFKDQNCKINKYENQHLENKQWYKLLREFYFLLDEQFYYELIQILEQLENKFSIEQITNYQIEKFLATKNLKDIQVIFKNLLIQIIKTGDDEDLNMNNLINSSSDEVFEIYKKKMCFYQIKVLEFISQLKYLFHDQQDFLNYETQGNYYVNLDLEDYYVQEEDIQSDPNVIN
ncbi:unnamed protein product [Paramecium pentaurelia]|uniref:Uncharacterized protein n=1 Tax=Paramecium pentaurelia TaxID=43138 RepID=A0A8S1UA52_9CILI|nr:unnamed protein product [Paramecium pentaurelia]